MGDNQQATPFPTPPPFYKHFTTSNLKRLRIEQKELNENEEGLHDATIDPERLPTELRYLVPPKPPVDGRWRSFGYEHDLRAVDPTLEEGGIPRLYPDHPGVKLAPQSYLLALSRSLLTTFLSTCGVLAQNPGLYEERTKNLKDMVLNMHDLINQYRPHQARESLIFMMEEHVEQMRQEIKSIEELKVKLQKTIDEMQQSTSVVLTETSMDRVAVVIQQDVVDARARQQQSAWEALNSLDDDEPDETIPSEEAFKTEDSIMEQG